MVEISSGKNLAREAITNLRDYPHPLARPLALCFAFDPANVQFFGTTCIELGFTLDAALKTPNEPLLAVIRIQWWIDAIQNADPAHAPLVHSLRILTKNEPKLCDQFIHVIGHWQSACRDESRSSRQGWQALWRLIASQLGQPSDTAANIGLFCLLSDAPAPPEIMNRNELRLLRRNSMGDPNQWLYLMACFGFYQRNASLHYRRNHTFALLGWRVFLWWLGRPPGIIASQK